VTSDRSSLIEVAGDAALTVSPFSLSAMADALKRADQDEALRSELIQRGLDRARTFTWRSCAEATLRVYQHVAAASPTSRRVAS
jgi:glycosyltransferase involved in cell wall biosynthesis